MNYFGTDLSSYGHYFWNLEGDHLIKLKDDFNSIPFNPEGLLNPYAQKGLVWYGQVEDYAICAVSGSCYDKRVGTKSVFWVKGEVKSTDWKTLILGAPIGKKMIEQMPFEVQW
jgi:hypothetical protein